MRTNVVRLSFLVLLLVLGGWSLSGQSRGRQGQGDGPPGSARGARGPRVLSAAPWDMWTAERLVQPGALADYGNHRASIQRREVGANAEVHDAFAHLMMFTSGQGRFITGGTIVDSADGKKAIVGGETHKIVSGVIWHIAANVPHQVLPDSGVVTYFVSNICTTAKQEC